MGPRDPIREVQQSSGSYPVYFGRGVLEELGEIVRASAGPRRPVVLAGRGVPENWVSVAAESCEAEPIFFRDGESDKTLGTVEALIGAMLDRGVRRDSVAVVVGGGTAGDTGGFTASVFMRGIPFILVPTTLLSQVDSSIGGKLGVNHPLGKNMIGSFQAPMAVVSDPVTWSTLAERERRSGLYEVLKAGVIADRDLFLGLNELETGSSAEALEAAVARSIGIKAGIVSRDEREAGERRLLNYGHTIGHAIERSAGYGSMTHGDAVAWGMIAANEIAVGRGILDRTERELIDQLILKWEPARLDPSRLDSVAGAVELDKKFTGGDRVMILPERIGRCTVVGRITTDEIGTAIALLQNYAER